MVVDTTKSCKPSILCDIPLVRGACGGCIGIPLSEEVIVELWLGALSLLCEVDFVLAKYIPLSVEVICVVPCLLCRDCIG